MPALRICGKPTCLAGDDLRVYTFFAVALRIVQLIALIPFTVITHGNYDATGLRCEGKENHPRLIQHSKTIFIVYLTLSYFLAVVGIGIELGIWGTTGRGTPTQPELRWKLRPLCLTKMVPMSVLRYSALVLAVLALVIVRDVCGCGTNGYSLNCPLYSTWTGKGTNDDANFIPLRVSFLYTVSFHP